MMRRWSPVIAAVSIVISAGFFEPSAAVADPQQRLAFMPYGEPWQHDLIKTAPPVYPYADRARWHQGIGLFRLTLDKKTGSVVRVTVDKSTGYKTLDDSAIAALKQWRFRPGKWKEVRVPVNFVMSKTQRDYINDIHRAHQQQRTM
jgi:TonB family protein